MVKAAVKSGVWDKVSYAQGDSLNKLSATFVSKVNEYRNNPCPATEVEMNAAGRAFKDAWSAIDPGQPIDGHGTQKKAK